MLGQTQRHNITFLSKWCKPWRNFLILWVEHHTLKEEAAHCEIHFSGNQTNFSCFVAVVWLIGLVFLRFCWVYLALSCLSKRKTPPLHVLHLISQVTWHLFQLLILLTIYWSSHQHPVFRVPSPKPLVGTASLMDYTCGRWPETATYKAAIQVQTCSSDRPVTCCPCFMSAQQKGLAISTCKHAQRQPSGATSPFHLAPRILFLFYCLLCIFILRLQVRQWQFHSPIHTQHQHANELRIHELKIRILLANYVRPHQYLGKIETHLSI